MLTHLTLLLFGRVWVHKQELVLHNLGLLAHARAKVERIGPTVFRGSTSMHIGTGLAGDRWESALLSCS
jgi:hypothetical protein